MQRAIINKNEQIIKSQDNLIKMLNKSNTKKGVGKMNQKERIKRTETVLFRSKKLTKVINETLNKASNSAMNPVLKIVGLNGSEAFFAITQEELLSITKILLKI